jgi:hypothetical protein
MNGIARSAVAALRALAMSKTSAAPPGNLRDDPQAQYSIAKAESMIEDNRLSVKDAFRGFGPK